MMWLLMRRTWRGHSCLPRPDSSGRSQPIGAAPIETSLYPAGKSALATGLANREIET
jgi:hypothetical protein